MMRDIDRLKERYPKSDPYEINDSFENGFSAGYAAGYQVANKEREEECRQLRECLSAILDRGETPEDSGSKADRG